MVINRSWANSGLKLSFAKSDLVELVSYQEQVVGYAFDLQGMSRAQRHFTIEDHPAVVTQLVE